MLPNALSIIRIILTVPIVIALSKGQYLLTILLFLLAGITDALDGWIAKQFSFQETEDAAPLDRKERVSAPPPSDDGYADFRLPVVERTPIWA